MIFLCPAGHTRRTPYLGKCGRCTQNEQKRANTAFRTRKLMAARLYFSLAEAGINWPITRPKYEVKMWNSLIEREGGFLLSIMTPGPPG